MIDYWNTQLENARFFENLWREIGRRDPPSPGLDPEYCEKRASACTKRVKELEQRHGK